MFNKYRYFPSKLLKSELIRSASVLITGSVVAQLLSILLQPFLRRFFSPESFGIYSVYLSLVGIIFILSSLRYDDAIVLPKSDKESINLVGLSLIINFIINFLIFILFLLLGQEIIIFLNLPENFPPGILLIIPVGAFLFGTYQALNNWLIRNSKYYSISANKLIRRSAEGVAQIGFAIAKSFDGLIYSDLVGQAASVTSTAIQAGNSKLNFKLISFNKLKYVFKKYSEFPRYNLIPAFMSSCSYLLPPIFINKFFSPQVAGFFDLSKLLLSVPMVFIASAISSVLLQRISLKFNKNESILSDLRPVFIIVVAIAIGEIASIIIFGEMAFKIIFGDQWITSGTISKIMVWSFAFNFLISSFSCIFVSMRKIKTFSIWQLIYFVSILTLFFFKDLPFTSFLKIYVLIEVLCYILVSFILLIIIHRYESSLKVKQAIM